MSAVARGFLMGFFGMAIVVALIIFWPSREPEPTPAPQPVATPTPEPPEPPAIEDVDLPPRPTIAVCCCGTNRYGVCIDMRMVREAARLHAIGHDNDLIGRPCASATEEELALRRVLRRPAAVEANTSNTLAMADRAARRERLSPS